MKGVAILIILLNFYFHANCQDSTHFVGRVWYIQNTNEFYTTLQLKDSVDEREVLDKLTENVDSVVTKEYFLTRKAINGELSQEYFDVHNLQNILVFNQTHELVTKATFARIEYYEDMIDGMFIAVFTPENMAEEQKNELIFYGLGAELQPQIVEKYGHEEITRKSLDKNIREFIVYNKDGLLKSKHIEIKQSPVDKVSILSIEDLERLSFASYLLEHESNSKINILKQLNEEYVFWDILPVPILVHNKPVFIVEIIIPESDYTGYMLAVYEGKEYLLKEKMEVKI